jgi:hypothetical protein
MELHLMHLMVHQHHVQQQEVAVVAYAQAPATGQMVVLVVVLHVTQEITLAALLLVLLVEQITVILHLLVGEMMVAMCQMLAMQVLTQEEAVVALPLLGHQDLTALHLVVPVVMV